MVSNTETFNLMMKTSVGINGEAYLRPETATTTYLPFKRFDDSQVTHASKHNSAFV